MDLDTTAKVLAVLLAMVLGGLAGGLIGWARKTPMIGVYVFGWALILGLVMYVIVMGVS